MTAGRHPATLPGHTGLTLVTLPGHTGLTLVTLPGHTGITLVTLPGHTGVTLVTQATVGFIFQIDTRDQNKRPPESVNSKTERERR